MVSLDYSENSLKFFWDAVAILAVVFIVHFGYMYGNNPERFAQVDYELISFMASMSCAAIIYLLRNSYVRRNEIRELEEKIEVKLDG